MTEDRGKRTDDRRTEGKKVRGWEGEKLRSWEVGKLEMAKSLAHRA